MIRIQKIWASRHVIKVFQSEKHLHLNKSAMSIYLQAINYRSSTNEPPIKFTVASSLSQIVFAYNGDTLFMSSAKKTCKFYTVHFSVQHKFFSAMWVLMFCLFSSRPSVKRQGWALAPSSLKPMVHSQKRVKCLLHVGKELLFEMEDIQYSRVLFTSE